MIVAWDDEDNTTGRLVPATSTGGTSAVTGLPFPPGLVIGYSLSDELPAQGSGGARGAAGFSVITTDFQWSALVDGTSSYGAFQSFQRGVVDRVSGTSVHAGTVELTDNGFIVTTEEDDIGSSDWVWHAFGHPDFAFTPQFYRVLPGGRIASIVVPPPPTVVFPVVTFTATTSGVITFTGFLLLEGGDQIILEDGSGFLLL
jgi:hypothetical protein